MVNKRTKYGQTEPGLLHDEFLGHLRRTLNHLYDPKYLRRSPLAALLGVADRFDTPTSLQRTLVDAVEALKPKTSEAAQSPSWRIYNLLSGRYVQQLNQQAVANLLGVSERTLRREQQVALKALADYLWERFNLAEVLSIPAEQDERKIEDALAWIKDAPITEPVDLARALTAVIALIQPLADQHNTRIQITLGEPLPKLAVHPIALNQILLNLLHVAIDQAPGDEVLLLAELRHQKIKIQVACDTFPGNAHPISDENTATMDMARKLVDLCGGELTFTVSEDTFNARLSLPRFEQLVVLAIDDQMDTLQLLERYTSGTRYRLISTRDPAQAESLVERYTPRAIILDVMMPEIDGWSVLSVLRRHPLASDVPIIVCTILPQRELAISLGADTFIHKPFTRQAFLDALNQQIQ